MTSQGVYATDAEGYTNLASMSLEELTLGVQISPQSDISPWHERNKVLDRRKTSHSGRKRSGRGQVLKAKQREGKTKGTLMIIKTTTTTTNH